MRLTRTLPQDFNGSMLVVLHLAQGGTSSLPQIIGRASRLPATHARDGEAIEPGRIYVAPPDNHLVVDAGAIRLNAGPKVNGHRPAIDPLFRSAAAAFGARTIGVVLSGTLDDGSAGLREIARAGGVVVVQDPGDATYPGMPTAAIASARPKHVLPVEEIGPLLVDLALQTVQDGGAMTDLEDTPDDETLIPPPPGIPAGFVCPECGGALWPEDDDGLSIFRCHVGHAYSTASFVAEHGAALEAALWTSYRTLQERAALARRLAERMRARGQVRSLQAFERQAEEALEHASVVRGVLLRLEPMEHETTAERGGER